MAKELGYQDSVRTVFNNPSDESRIHNLMGRAQGLTPYSDVVDGYTLPTNAQGEIAVYLDPDQSEGGNLQKEIPSLVIEGASGRLALTWEEARRLCAALWQVTNVAEFG